MLLLILATLASAGTPPCRPAQLRLSVDDGGGDFTGMSHAGTRLSLRNRGAACMLPALPLVELRDARGHLLPAVRQVPAGMHPGPVLHPVRIGGGQRATIDLRWVSGPVFDRNRSIRAANVAVHIGGQRVSAPLLATLYGESGRRVTFDQAPARAAEGMAAQ